MNRNVIIGIVIGVIVVLAFVVFNGMNNSTTVDASNAPPVLDQGTPAPADPAAPEAPATPTP